MPSITTVLRAVAPNINPVFLAASKGAPAILAEFGIVSLNAQAQVIAQCAHESGGYRRFEENLNFSADGLMRNWPKKFPTRALADQMAHNPRAIANYAYNGRMGNRPGSNDGWEYRGSGPLQHTGASEFDRVVRRTGLPVRANPALLRDPRQAETMWRAACSFIADRGVLPPADRGDTRTATRIINGGQNGIADRMLLVARATAAMQGRAIEADARDTSVVVVGPKTSTEQADDATRRAKTATNTAVASGPTTGGASKTQTDWSGAIIIGITAALLVGFIAILLWRHAKRRHAAVEDMHLQSLASRAEIETV
jgi:putative chitinase